MSTMTPKVSEKRDDQSGTKKNEPGHKASEHPSDKSMSHDTTRDPGPTGQHDKKDKKPLDPTGAPRRSTER